MKGISSWTYRPYKPFFFDCGDIYICRVVPTKNAVFFEWLGDGSGVYEVYYRKENDGEYILAGKTDKNEYNITGLPAETDYEFYVQSGDKKSRVRLARTGEGIGGVVVNYLHPRDEAYSFSGHCLCSPSMVRHPDGYLIASMDLFAQKEPQNLTLIFRSDDDGNTWHYVSELMPCFWGKLFIHKGRLYMLSCSTEYGDLLIGASDDGGKTFCTPTVLMRGSGRSHKAGCHKSPENVVRYNGRLWETMEWGSWGEGYHAPMIMSIDENDDLLVAENWSFAPPIKYDPNWKGLPKGESSGCIEGALTVAPDGKLYNIMRYDMLRLDPDRGLAIAFAVNTDDPESPLRFDHTVPFMGNHSKFEILFDEKSGYYYSIVSRIYDGGHAGARNLLSLIRSKDAYNWENVADLIDRRDVDRLKIGFQYVEFIISGDDILYLSRTAVNGCENFHNSNYITFHRIKDFRKLEGNIG